MKQGVTIRNFSDSVELTEIHAIPSRPTISSNAKGPLIIKRANSYLRLVPFTFHRYRIRNVSTKNNFFKKLNF